VEELSGAWMRLEFLEKESTFLFFLIVYTTNAKQKV